MALLRRSPASSEAPSGVDLAALGRRVATLKAHVRRLSKELHELRDGVDEERRRRDARDAAEAAAPEPVRVQPEPEPVVAAPEPEPEPVVAAPEPEPEPEPEPVVAAPEPAPVAVAPEPVAADPEPEPLAAVAGLGAIAAAIAGGNLAALAEDDAADRILVTSGSANVGEEEGGIHEAPDGSLYWGPIDNESARAKACGQTLVIDQVECINCGTCVENTDYVFALPDDGKAVAVRQEGNMELIQDAIDACPVTCIHWTDEPGRFPQLNDAEGKELR